MPGIEEALYWLVLSSQGVWCKWQGLLLYTRLLCAKLNGPLMFPSLCPLVRHLRGPLSGFCLFLLSSFICCLKSSSGSLLLSTDVQWSASAIEVGKIDLIRLEEATGRKWHLREKVISESTSKGCLVGQFCPKCAGEPVRVLKGHDLCAYEASSSDCSWKIGLGRVRIKAGKKQMKWYHIEWWWWKSRLVASVGIGSGPVPSTFCRLMERMQWHAECWAQGGVARSIRWFTEIAKTGRRTGWWDSALHAWDHPGGDF